MKNIHILPTDKPSRLFIHNAFNDLRLDTKNVLHDNNQNLYFTSDEEPNDGDWHLVWLRGKWEVLNYMPSIGYRKECLGKEVCKIILTTDAQLIEAGVQAIDDEFLEWFVKNPSCEFVEIKPKLSYIDGKYIDSLKIIIPKEKPKNIYKMPLAVNDFGKTCISEPKQEILEQAAEKYNSIKIAREAFIAGAKWQAESSYDKETVNELFDTLKRNSINNSITITNIDIFIKSWKEEFILQRQTNNL